MTDRVWLVRHASTAWTGRRWCGRSDPPLSARGRREAAALADHLRALVPGDATILTSPLRRARETATAIAAARPGAAEPDATTQPVETVADLIEVDFGSVDGKTWPEVERDLPELARRILAGREVDWPAGESAEGIAVRISSARAAIETRARPLVVVSHSAVLGALAGELTRSPILARTALAPAAALELRREGRRWRPVTGRP